MTRKVTIFGSTGSIGCNTVDLIERDPDAFEVVAVTGGRNIEKLAHQARSLGAEIAVTAHDALLPDLREALAGRGVPAAAGEAALCRPSSARQACRPG